jgi:DNA (cytosine-5)-methyltransferase 1
MKLRKAAKVIACVNHDKNAIVSHQANHPDCLHFTEDIRTLDLTALVTVARHSRKIFDDVAMLFIDLFCGAGGVTTGIEHAKMYEDLKVTSNRSLMCLWASLECTNFSKAKGGLPRNADSRTLAEHLFRYLDAIDFDCIFIENVEEFMSWGPLDKEGKPISKDRGRDYIKWVESMKAYGYEFEHRILNAADYGAHTNRKRYFGIFAKPGIQISWPEPTHSRKGDKGLQKWRAVKEVLDFSDEGESIFTRKKPLSERTLERIYAGLVKYVAGGDTSFIQKHYSGRPMGKVNSVDSPCATITTVANLSLVQSFMMKYNSTNLKTGKHIPPSVDAPSPALSTQDRLGLVNASFIAYYYTQTTLSSTDDPCNTLRTKDTGQVVMPQFWIDRQFGQGGGKLSSIDDPIGTLPAVPKANLASAWILSPHFDNKGNSIDEPMPVITANKKHHCLMFPQWGTNCSHSIDRPSPVLPARMDKMCPYIIQADQTGEPIAIIVYDDDTEAMKKIKQFMAAYGIVDIKMRMLRIKELKKITGFNEDYILVGTQQQAKKYIGNAVPVLLAKAIIEGFAKMLHEPIRKIA